MYTSDIIALAAAVVLGLIVIGLGCCYVFLKNKQSKRHFELNNITSKYMQIVKGNCPPIKLTKKA